MNNHALPLNSEIDHSMNEAQHREYLQMEMESEALMGDVLVIERVQALNTVHDDEVRSSNDISLSVV